MNKEHQEVRAEEHQESGCMLCGKSENTYKQPLLFSIVETGLTILTLVVAFLIVGSAISYYFDHVGTHIKI